MNKITKIVLLNDRVFIYRGNSWHTYFPKHITDASRLRLNDVLAVWSRTSKVESHPYVGPDWCINTLNIVDVPVIKKNVNAGKIAEELDRIQGLNDGLASAVLYTHDDAEALREAINKARSELIQIMLALREIEKES